MFRLLDKAAVTTHPIRALVLAALFGAVPAHAATFNVDSTVDADDANKGDGVCITAGGLCTLRAAISEANKTSGTTHIINVPAGTYVLSGAAGENNNVGGDLDIAQKMEIRGAGIDTTVINGNGIDRIFEIEADTALYDMTLQNGACNDDGGGIYNNSNLTSMTRVRISGCTTSKDGGGIRTATGTFSMTDVAISNCSVTGGGKGGAIHVSSGHIYMTNATINNNSAAVGGGLSNMSGAGNTLTNVTISSNIASNQGGGIHNQSGNNFALMNVTVANNSAPTGAGISRSTGSFILTNTILANNTPGANCAGSVTSNGYNLDSANSCGLSGSGDKINGDAKLGVLQNNGGPTLTHALVIGSAAIDAGTSTGAPATDQRGVARPHGMLYDIGAYEGIFVPSYQPDAMVKIGSEGAGSYLTDNVYEAAASAQAKNGGALTGATATYTLLFQNDGNVADTLKIAGTGTGSGFTVQYLDETSTDRTAAVTGAGYTMAALSPGASKLWTLKVSPTSSPVPVLGGASLNVLVTATSTTDGTKKDQVSAVTTSTSAHVSLVKSADKATAKPGDDILFTTNATNASPSNSAGNVVLRESIPANTGFKVVAGNPSFSTNNSTLNCTISYSNDNRTSWTYTPASGGCSAPASYDYCVTDVEWRANETDTMPAGSSFSVGVVVGVK